MGVSLLTHHVWCSSATLEGDLGPVLQCTLVRTLQLQVQEQQALCRLQLQGRVEGLTYTWVGNN